MLVNKRAKAFQKARAFFEERGIVEADCPLLSRFASIDAHIDLIEASTFQGKRFLITSPEYAMKRLLSKGAPDIYFLGHVFRDSEYGPKHNPEFTMAEWYRRAYTMGDMIAETLEFCKLFTGPLPVERYTYHQAFRYFAGQEVGTQDLDLVMINEIEPRMNKEALTIISHFPACQAALAMREGTIAHRFEIYAGGIELCNGYHELTDPLEQKKRFIEENKRRNQLCKAALPMDLFLLDALETFPPCSGVAVGFDRLLMLEWGAKHIEEVQLFSWNNI